MEGDDIDYISKVAVNSLGEIYVVGEFTSENISIDGTSHTFLENEGNILLAKFTSNGDFQWIKSCGSSTPGTDNGYACWPTSRFGMNY